MGTISRTTVRLRPRNRKNVQHRVAVFTSIDGVLLDAQTFAGRESRDVARRLAAQGIPLVPVSVMTLEELEPIADEFRMRHAMVIEGGGGIAR
jgi:predicted mannosyl-3-phosphoglycerate phosphatase (HAD superfamily)